ncbi:MAG: M48 family metallopeptidase [Hyphomicrobiales bacterium]|nr:M48 family metallopeptidase [Hyphomicrobiales bacterium]
MSRRRSTSALATAVVAALAVAPKPAAADPTIIRDAEIEQLLRDYTAPIFRAAGISSRGAQVILVGDRSFNAFVADGQKIFVNVGALLETKTPNEMIGVLAHECGHIAGGHLVRMRQELANAQILSIAGMLASAGAVAAQAVTSRGGARPGGVGMDQAGMAGVLTGPQELVRRSLLSYQRAQESAADSAGVKFLTATHQSAKGMLKVLQHFANDSLFISSSIDPYLITHPLPTERISNLEQIAKASPYFDVKDSPELQMRHDLMRAKLLGFVGDPAEVLRRYPMSDSSLPARYARAISDYRFGKLDQALAEIDGLIASKPGDPYFYELKGQALLEGGRAEASLPLLRKASAMAPKGAPIRVLLGHALVSAGGKANDAEAVRVLARTTQDDPDSAEGFQYLAMAYNREGDIPRSQLASAQAFFISGKYVEARTQAKRAQDQFKQGSPGWLKADDILNYRPPEPD